MATRITNSGRITLPRKVRAALRLSPGDAVEFTSNGSGEFVIHKAAPVTREPRAERPEHPRAEAQRRRRAAELLALLRGLD